MTIEAQADACGLTMGLVTVSPRDHCDRLGPRRVTPRHAAPRWVAPHPAAPRPAGPGWAAPSVRERAGGRRAGRQRDPAGLVGVRVRDGARIRPRWSGRSYASASPAAGTTRSRTTATTGPTSSPWPPGTGWAGPGCHRQRWPPNRTTGHSSCTDPAGGSPGNAPASSGSPTTVTPRPAGRPAPPTRWSWPPRPPPPTGQAHRPLQHLPHQHRPHHRRHLLSHRRRHPTLVCRARIRVRRRGRVSPSRPEPAICGCGHGSCR